MRGSTICGIPENLPLWIDLQGPVQPGEKILVPHKVFTIHPEQVRVVGRFDLLLQIAAFFNPPFAELKHAIPIGFFFLRHRASDPDRAFARVDEHVVGVG